MTLGSVDRLLWGVIFFISLFFFFSSNCLAHFGVVMPSKSIVEDSEKPVVDITLSFMHPFEGKYMELTMPLEFAVISGGQKSILTNRLKPVKEHGHQTWMLSYRMEHPGDHIFYMIPSPYWEPSEDTFIQHYTKVVVNAFGLEDAWYRPVGLRAEIVPLSRPYGLWKGNLFCGKVLFEGKSMGGVPVEVEYYNTGHRIDAPSDVFVTQVVRTDTDGRFCYAMPFAGWWGFAALIEDEKGMQRDGRKVGLEIGAVLWVETKEQR